MRCRRLEEEIGGFVCQPAQELGCQRRGIELLDPPLDIRFYYVDVQAHKDIADR